MRYVLADKDFYAVALPFFFIVGVYCGSATILWLFVAEMQDCRTCVFAMRTFPLLADLLFDFEIYWL